MRILIAFILCGKLECIPVEYVLWRPYEPSAAGCQELATGIAKSWAPSQRLLTAREAVCMPAD